MLARTSFCCMRRNPSGKTKFPSVVSYNRLPWEQLAAHSNKLHEAVSPHYSQLLSLVAQRKLPQLVMQTHIQIPREHQLRLLPGTVYLMAHTDAIAAAPAIPGWDKKVVTDSHSTQYYGCGELLHGQAVSEVATFVSPDLRIYCNAVSFVPKQPHHVVASSSLAEVSAGGSGFTIFHYYRPNRPASEVVQPLLQFYRHIPSLSVVGEFASGSWSPRLDAPRRSPTAKVTPNKPFVPPQSYLQGLAERQAVIPGNSFGRRSLMWGHWF